jgi:UPF0716 protein FxsA
MRSQGRRAWRRFTEAMSAGRVPAREVLDGGMVIFGGAFLLTPGFLTDIIGIALLLPPTRAVVRRFVLARFTFGLGSAMGAGRVPGTGRSERRAASGGYDVDGTAHEVDVTPPSLGRETP